MDFHNRHAALVIFSCIFLAPLSANAFGIGDVISVGISAGAKVGGALVDKAVDSMKDPAEEQRKRDAQKAKNDEQMRAGFQKALSEIEAKKDLTPFQREKLKLSLINSAAAATALAQFAEEMTARQEAQRRAERDSLLSVGGIANTVGAAALSSPSVMMAQADRMAKSGMFQQQARDMMAQADGRQKVSAGATIANISNVIDAQDKMNTALDSAQRQAKTELQPVLTKIEQDSAERGEQFAELAGMRKPMQDNFFAQDFDKPIFVEYIDNAEQTQKLREILASQGFTLADSKESAKAYFRIEGEYMIPQTGKHEGSAISSGKALTNPTMVTVPAKRSAGLVASALGGAIGAIRSGMGKPAPGEAPQSYEQMVLVVASRQVGNEEIRLSSVQKQTAPDLIPVELITAAQADLYAKLGLSVGVSSLQKEAQAKLENN